MSSTVFYPTSSKEILASLYLGKSLSDVPTPAAVIDLAAARRNCERMLQACQTLGLVWRAHVKTHKTVELTRLQVGEDVALPVNLVVSTLAEVEFLLPLLKEYKSQNRRLNVLYGLPINSKALPRLAAVARELGEGSISVLLDDPAQISVLSRLRGLSGVTPLAHIKIDMGGRRAGVINDSPQFLDLLNTALDGHKIGDLILSGFYSHAGHSYGGDSRAAAIKMLNAEIAALFDGAQRVAAKAAEKGISKAPLLTLSAGASPTALSIQNLLSGDEDGQGIVSSELRVEASSLSALFDKVERSGHIVEIHAGVYPTLDLQQLAAHSISSSLLSWRDIAMTVLAEVHSIYPGRGADGTTEALIGAGGLALGREFCKAYDGMAILTPWGRHGVQLPEGDVEAFRGWTVGRFSQEHGILTWDTGKAAKGLENSADDQDELEVGQTVRLWPNHACITSSHFGWYFVVDEDRFGREDEIVDIWVKARGW